MGLACRTGDGRGLWTTALQFRGKRGKCLCNGLYVDARPGTMTAVMGLSGCGKSVLLRIIAGIARPTLGQVLLNGEDVYARGSLVHRQIGYVPQAEILIPELAVGVSLDYRLRFRNPELSPAQRAERCVEVCRHLGLSDVESLLKKQIGAPEWRGEYPSGGERRRVSIAHELLSDPAALLMDEPTSGLSSVDSDTLIRQMQRLCRERAIPILMTIHQPSQETFARFDEMLVIASGGIPVYYGPREHAAEYVEQVTALPRDPSQNPADYVLSAIRTREAAAWLAAQFSANCASGKWDYLKRPRGVLLAEGVAAA